MAAANETILWGAVVDYGQTGIGGLSYGGGGVIAGSALAQFEANVGKKCSIVHIYGRWADSGALHPFSTYTTNLNFLTAAGRIPFLDWAPWDLAVQSNSFLYRFTEITAGTWDTFITQWATDAKAWGKPLIVRIWWEMNILGTNFPWHYGPTDTGTATIASSTYTFNGHSYVNTCQDYIAAHRHVVNIFRNVVGATNVKIVWNPNVIGSSATLTLARQWPGTDATSGRPWADIMAIDGYTDEVSNGRLNESLQDTFRGGISVNGGYNTGLADTYGQMIALDPTLPVMICETGWWGTRLPSQAISNIVANGTTWTITTSASMDSNLAATQGVWITGVSPAGYYGEYTVASTSGLTNVVINNTTSPGAFVSGSIQLVDRIGRATAITTSLESDIPTMSRIKYFVPFWTAYNASQWTTDYDGTAGYATTVDTVALSRAIGNSHYLAGGQMLADTSTLSMVPYQDQAVAAPFERYRAIAASTIGAVSGWLLNDVVGTTTLPDVISNRNATVNGAITLGNAGSVPAETTWTSAKFPGTPAAANNISIAHNANFSATTTNRLSIEASFMLPTTPAAQGVIVSKGAASNFEWSIFVTATTVGFTAFQLTGGTYASNTFTLPANGVWHHVVGTLNLATTSAPLNFYLDGTRQTSGAASGSMGTPGTGAAVQIGARADAVQPISANAQVGPVYIYNQELTPESVADKRAVWQAGPVITSLTAS